MTIIGVVRVKNEGDIIEAFVRHNLAFLDRLIVLDHDSADDTSAILARLMEEGLPLVVETDRSLGRFQAEKMTRLMQRAVNEFKADWVALLDADELIKCSEERLRLPNADTYPGFLKVAARTYQSRESDDRSMTNPAERIIHRLKFEPYEERGSLQQRSFFVKAVVPRSLVLTEGTCVVSGNHHVETFGTEPPHELWSGFEYAHYSLRTPGQYAMKVTMGTIQELYRSSTRGSMNSYYLSHLKEITSNFERFSDGFHERLPSYIEKVRGFTPAFVREPLSYRGGPLRYTSMASDHTRLIANLVGFAETLARSGAPHAANNLSHRNSIGEMARLEVVEPSAAGAQPETAVIAEGQVRRVTLRVRVPPGATSVHIRMASSPAVVELTEVRWIGDSTSEVRVVTGRSLRSGTFAVRNLLPILHDQYATFIKSGTPGVFGLTIPRDVVSGLRAVELQLQIETDPTRIGVRLLQGGTLDGLSSLEERVRRLESELADKTTFGGACRFQGKRLWRAVRQLLGWTK